MGGKGYTSLSLSQIDPEIGINLGYVIIPRDCWRCYLNWTPGAGWNVPISYRTFIIQSKVQKFHFFVSSPSDAIRSGR